MMLEKLANIEALTKSWQEIKHRLLSCGIDGVTIFSFKQNLDQNLQLISNRLLSGKYVFSSLKAAPVDQKKSDGTNKIRALSVPTVADRVVQRALLNAIGPRLSIDYDLDNEVSFGYLKGYGTRDAIDRVRELYREGYRFVFQADVINFFPSVDRERLISQLILPKLQDDSLAVLLRAALKIEIGNRPDLYRKGSDYLRAYSGVDEGLAQGCVLSPFLSNVYLNKLDQAMIQSGFKMVRYADDFLVMTKTPEIATKAHALARNILADLDLRIDDVGKGKARIGVLENIEFLGVNFVGEKTFPSTKSLNKLYEFFDAAPKSYSNLYSAISGISSRARSWGDSFGFTDIRARTVGELDARLKKCIRVTLAEFNLRPIRSSLGPGSLGKLGVMTIGAAVRQARQREKVLELSKLAK